MVSVWLLFTSNLNSQTAWLKVKFKHVNLEEDSDGQGHNPFLVCHARMWSGASTVQLVPGGSAAIQSML